MYEKLRSLKEATAPYGRCEVNTLQTLAKVWIIIIKGRGFSPSSFFLFLSNQHCVVGSFYILSFTFIEAFDITR